jgi:hypothetical protein
MSDTPRTDAAERRADDRSWMCCDKVVDSKLTRDLERELAAALAERDEARKALREAMTYLESTDGTRGYMYGCAVNALTFLNWVRAAGLDKLFEMMDATRTQTPYQVIARIRQIIDDAKAELVVTPKGE